jgi:AraC-like DNA-binding protein
LNIRQGQINGSADLTEVTDFPTQCTVLVSARTNNIAKIITMEYVFDLSDPYEYRIEKALDLLNRELDPNYGAMAKRAGLVHSTLSRRFRGVTASRAEANSEYRQCLTIAQEEALIEQINNFRSEICLLLRGSSKTWLKRYAGGQSITIRRLTSYIATRTA